MKKNSLKIKRLVGLATLSAIVIVLQVFSNYIQFGPVSITLALIPIVVGAIVFGPKGGFVLGLVHGAIVCTAPATIGLFMPVTVIGTILVCLLKSSIAGLVSGLLFQALKKKNTLVAVVVASVIVPIVNTGIFSVACFTIFEPLIAELASTSGKGFAAYFFLIFIGYNFIIELVVNSVLSPVVLRIVKMYNIDEKFGSKVEL